MTDLNIIQTNNLSVKIKNQLILSELNFNCQVGEIIVLLGANGSGKSTLLKTLAGIIKPTIGQIIYKGKSLSDYTPLQYARQFSYVPQSQTLDADLKVLDYVGLGRYPFTGILPILSPSDIDIVKTALSKFELNYLENKKMNELSGGEQQRAHIARVLATNTELLLLDEPTNSLDIKNQREFIKIIKNLKNQNKTIIIALHSIDIATQLADKLILLNKGKIIFADNPAQHNLEKILSETFSVPIVKRQEYDFELP